MSIVNLINWPESKDIFKILQLQTPEGPLIRFGRLPGDETFHDNIFMEYAELTGIETVYRDVELWRGTMRSAPFPAEESGTRIVGGDSTFYTPNIAEIMTFGDSTFYKIGVDRDHLEEVNKRLTGKEFVLDERF